MVQQFNGRFKAFFLTLTITSFKHVMNCLVIPGSQNRGDNMVLNEAWKSKMCHRPMRDRQQSENQIYVRSLDFEVRRAFGNNFGLQGKLWTSLWNATFIYYRVLKGENCVGSFIIVIIYCKSYVLTY